MQKIESSAYALCAFDALGIHFLLHSPTKISTQCEHTNKEIYLELENEQLKNSKNSSIILGIPDSERGKCTATTLCPRMHFFYSQKIFNEWAKRQCCPTNYEHYSINEAIELSKQVFGYLPFDYAHL